MGQPAFLHFSQPVGGDDLVTHLGDGGEAPQLFAVQGVCVFAALQEYFFHGGQVVLQAVVYAGKQAGAQLDLQHASFKLDGVSVFEAAGALEHLHGSGVSVYLDDLCHHLYSLEVDVADLILGDGPVYLYGNQVGDDTRHYTFCFHISCLYFSVYSTPLKVPRTSLTSCLKSSRPLASSRMSQRSTMCSLAT